MIDDMISVFDSGATAEAPFAVNFSAATPLKRHGSTCDAFECTVQRRRVFVKRLKAEYRSNPLYRAAFDKEFDLGVSLSHPSLPRYVGFGGDYIVMDFIEGDTLADLIKRGDRRLKNRKFVKKLLRELTDVAKYLHNRNVVHCDIKADNIIISPYADRPATLIDLDKAYSPWLDSTHGDVAKYGCDRCADGAIDFRGIRLIADQLGIKRFAFKSLIWPISILLLIIAAIVLAFGRTDNPVAIGEPTTAVPVPTPSAEPSAESPSDSRAATSSASVPDIEAIVRRHYGPLAEQQDYLRALAADSTVTSRDLRLAFGPYAEDQFQAQGRIISEAQKLYHFTNPLDVFTLLGNSRRWGTFMRADAELNALYSREIDAREAKESQRPSGRPVSPPDTLPDDTLPAPRR